MLGGWMIAVRELSTGPAAPMPIPAAAAISSAGASARISLTIWSVMTRASGIFAGSREDRVVTICPRSSTRPTRRFVAPRSTAMTKSPKSAGPALMVSSLLMPATRRHAIFSRK